MAENLSPRTRAVLRRLDKSGSSEAMAVADALGTIAENGGESCEDRFLVGCAEQIIGAAAAFIRSVSLDQPGRAGGKPDISDELFAKELVELLLLHYATPTEIVSHVDAKAAEHSDTSDERFARTAWSVGDVMAVVNITEDAAREFLCRHAKQLAEEAAQRGWAVIEDLAIADNLQLHDPNDFD